MRTLKFRAWDGTSMRYDVTGFEHGKANEMAGIFLNGDYHAISETPVMQFTGLFDTNGKEVYEGDIMQMYKYSDGNPCVVTFDDGCYNCFPFGTLDAAVEFGTVIGNIYENPEFIPL